jgi:hypothetical protein
VAAAFVGPLGVLGWTLGLAVGDLPGRPGSEPIVSTSEAARPGVPSYPAIRLTAAMVHDFDPLGRDHQENPGQVPNAFDDDPSTAWVTQAYKTADFSGLKPGVGLLVDLGKPTALHTVTVGFTAAGARVEVRVADDPPKGPDDTRLVAGDDGHQVAAMKPVSGTKARYVLIWITQLPKDGKTYQVGVSELRLS